VRAVPNAHTQFQQIETWTPIFPTDARLRFALNLTFGLCAAEAGKQNSPNSNRAAFFILYKKQGRSSAIPTI
jgi:hypothetical protein